MREFYSKYKQIDKLEKIEEEWISILDEQYREKRISPWMPHYDQEPVEDYRLSMYPVFSNLVELKEYFIAEKLFVHMVKECPDYVHWTGSDMLYFQVEREFLSKNDTANLSTWYGLWFNTLNNYCCDKQKVYETLNQISEKYIGRDYDFPNMAEKYYHKILSFTYKFGGDSAVYQMLINSLESYYATPYEKIKFNLFALKICIKNDDIANTESHYKSLDYLVSSINSDENGSKHKIIDLLSDTEKATKNPRLKKWCTDAIKKIH
jgi:hypothetical protein